DGADVHAVDLERVGSNGTVTADRGAGDVERVSRGDDRTLRRVDRVGNRVSAGRRLAGTRARDRSLNGRAVDRQLAGGQSTRGGTAGRSGDIAGAQGAGTRAGDRGNADHFTLVRTDLEVLAGEGTIEQLDAVEGRRLRDAIDFRLQLLHFGVEGLAVA